ncbi:MAG: serine/threonine-protein kinase [Pseudomonadota bacterium]
MEPDRWDRLQRIFDVAANIASEDARSRYLTSACGDDPALAREVVSLLEADRQTKDGFLSLTQSRPPGASAQRPEDAGTASHTTGVSTQSGLSRLGHYELKSRLGSGAVGVVFVAHDLKLLRDVAVKVLAPEYGTRAPRRERFLREAQAVSAIDHPNVCGIYDFGEAPSGELFLTMPLYRGETLAERLGRGALAPSPAAVIGLDIVAGLHAAHAAGVVHRDIKPANVMLTHRGDVKLIDFGIAKAVGEAVTVGGFTLGSLAYIAPEALRGERADERSDIWSLGVTFFEMLTGDLPFDAEHPNPLQGEILSWQGLSTPQCKRLPHEFRDIVARMLRPNLDARDISLEAIRVELEALSPSETLRRRRRSRLNDAVRSRIVDAVSADIGPSTDDIVFKLAQTSGNTHEFRERLLEHIPSAGARTAARRRLLDVMSEGARREGVTLSSELKANVQRALAEHVGPIAAALVSHHAARSSKLSDFVEALVSELDTEAERTAFFRAIRRAKH